MQHPCLRCGACCSYFRVAFHWSEADASLGGQVPPDLTEKLDHHRLIMRGTRSAPVRCTGLQGVIGKAAHCGIYEQRPSVCREMQPSWESGTVSVQCDKARVAHGLPPLTLLDWELSAMADNDPELQQTA